jgi:hypothetical protein
VASVDREERVKTSLVGFAVIAAFSPFVVAASAEPYDVAPIVVPDGIFGMPPSDILVIVQSRGLHPVGPPIRRGRVYVLRAMDPSGENVRVVVDAASGRIYAVTPADSGPPEYGPGPGSGYGSGAGYGPGSGYGPGPGYGPPGPGYGPPAGYGPPGPGYAPGPSYGQPGSYYYGPGYSPNYYGRQDQQFKDGAPVARGNPTPAVRTKPSDPRSAALATRTPLPRPRPVNAAIVTPADAAQATNGASQQSGDKADEPTGTATPVLPPVTPLD